MRLILGKEERIMLDIKLSTLLSVSETGNYTKTAKELSMTQPAVSQHISQLEKELGVKLFVRNKGGFVPTPEGEIAIKYARRMRALYEKMMLELASGEQHLTKLRVGITHTAESSIITRVLARYGMRNNKVSITVITDTIKNLYDMIKNYELDMAIVEGKLSDPNLNYLMLDTDYLVCVMSNDSPLSKNSMVTLEQIKKEKMILRLPSSATRQLFEATLRSVNENIDDFNILLEVDNIATIADLVRRDMGISILPKSACRSDIRNNRLKALPIENLSMLRETNIIYTKDFGHVEALQDIVNIYHETQKRYAGTY